MTYASFEKLEVWKRSCRLAVEICKTMRDCKIYVLRDQMSREVDSNPKNKTITILCLTLNTFYLKLWLFLNFKRSITMPRHVQAC
jgi:hypothetical protein